MYRNNNTPITNNGYSSFFDSQEEYESFIAAMRDAAENYNLPLALEYNSPAGFTTDAIRAFSLMFKKDTGLDIEFRFFTCNNCDRLHLVLVVGDRELDDEWD